MSENEQVELKGWEKVVVTILSLINSVIFILMVADCPLVLEFW